MPRKHYNAGSSARTYARRMKRQATKWRKQNYFGVLPMDMAALVGAYLEGECTCCRQWGSIIYEVLKVTHTDITKSTGRACKCWECFYNVNYNHAGSVTL